MNTKKGLLFLFILMLFQSAIAQKIRTTSPKIENYTKGDLEIKVAPFGLENPISVGNITADGAIHLSWPELDLSKIEGSEFYMTSIQQLIGGSFCKDPSAVITNENAKSVQVEFLFLYKYGKQVGAIIPSTQKDQEHSKEQLGTTINWFYSDTETNAKANCSQKKEWEGSYNFNETTAYDLQFKKEWNLVSYTLKEIEEWKNGTEQGSLPKTKIVQSLDQIPTNINWHLKYWANDELLEIEHQLVMLKPITKEHYESWLPKKLGNMKRIGYEVGKELERMPTLNNVNMLFEKGSKKIDLTIVDCANNKDAASMYTLMKDMASRDWNDKTKTGYKSAAKMDDKRVMTDYNEKEAKTLVSYNANGRFLIKAEASNVKPEELWKHLKTLNLEPLIKE